MTKRKRDAAEIKADRLKRKAERLEWNERCSKRWRETARELDHEFRRIDANEKRYGRRFDNPPSLSDPIFYRKTLAESIRQVEDEKKVLAALAKVRPTRPIHSVKLENLQDLKETDERLLQKSIKLLEQQLAEAGLEDHVGDDPASIVRGYLGGDSAPERAATMEELLQNVSQDAVEQFYARTRQRRRQPIGAAGFYCVRCRQATTGRDVHRSQTRKGQPMLKGQCARCGTRVNRFIQKT